MMATIRPIPPPTVRRTAFLIAMLTLAAACSAKSRPPAGAPAAGGPPAAPSAAGGAASGLASVGLAPAGLAVVPVHVTYVLRSLRPSLDSLFPARDSLSQSACNTARGLICHQYVYRRDSLVMRATGNQLSIETQLGFRAQLGAVGVNRLASCGYAPESMRRAQLSMQTALYWRRDWRIGARDSRLRATLLDQCLVSIFGVNATRTLQDVLNRQLSDFAADADTAIPAVANLKPLADSLWRSFVEPTMLDSAGTLWLLLEPEAVRVAPLTGSGPSFATAIVLYARPRVVSGARPTPRARPLPALTMGDAPRGFDMPVSVELPFDEVERRAEALLKADPATGGVRVDSVHVRGTGDSVQIGLDVSGSIRGRLSMVSRLRWDDVQRELRLDDFTWSLESQGMLSRVKATLAAPLIGRAIRRATMGGRVPLGAQLDSVRAELMRKLNGSVAPGVVLGSSVTTLQITAVSSTATAFVVRARLGGQAGVWFQ